MENFNDVRKNVNMDLFHECIKIGVEYTLKQCHISRKTLHEICRLEDIEIPKKGRKQKEINKDDIKFIIDYRNKYSVGYQRLSDISSAYNVPINSNQVRNVYKKNNLFLHQKKKKNMEKHDKLFVAKYANQLWHTDIHYVTVNNDRKYLIGFIDDRTRLLLHYEIINEKTSYLCANALINAIQKFSSPKTITIDNGGEFIGDSFQSVIKAYNIEEFRTRPYTPQQNGKIERFWSTIEKCATQELFGSYLQEIIEQYNLIWPHHSLQKLTGNKMTPYQAWLCMEHWNWQLDADIEFI